MNWGASWMDIGLATIIGVLIANIFIDFAGWEIMYYKDLDIISPTSIVTTVPFSTFLKFTIPYKLGASGPPLISETLALGVQFDIL